MNNKKTKLVVVTMICLMWSLSANSAVIEVDATLTANISDTGSLNGNNANRLIAYTSFNGNSKINDYMKFDLSAIVDDSTINSITLRGFF